MFALSPLMGCRCGGKSRLSDTALSGDATAKLSASCTRLKYFVAYNRRNSVSALFCMEFKNEVYTSKCVSVSMFNVGIESLLKWF